MKALYFDCNSGISGNMTLGALLELVDNKEELIDELNKLHVDGYHIDVSTQVKNGITATHVNVVLEEHHHHKHHHDHEHQHHHHHEHRNLYDIEKIIDESAIDVNAKDLAKRIFRRVALAESKVHNEPLENVHFHEVGAIDSIVDIIGTAILIEKIKPDVIYSSIVNDGYGFIECAHGTIAVPVPATSEIFAASNVISRQIDIDTELVTPTGAAIIAELASSFGVMPAMNVQRIGWGCGTKNLRIPNVLKVTMGEIKEEDHDQVIVIETNIDDCTGEVLSYTMERLFTAGALDVFFTPIFMKKNRPAYRLTITCQEENIETMRNILFKETTTIGMRYRQEKRFVLNRQIKEVDTPYGKVHMKCCEHQGAIYEYPEFEDLKQIALKTNLSIQEIMKLVIK